MKILLACLIAALTYAAPRAHAAAPLTLQTCTVAPTSTAIGSVAGCPGGSFLFAAVAPATLVRFQVSGVQGWRAFNALSPTDQVYASDYAWHVLASITPALQPPSTAPPVTLPPPPAPPVCPDKIVPLQWACSVTNRVATCTAPVPP